MIVNDETLGHLYENATAIHHRIVQIVFCWTMAFIVQQSLLQSQVIGKNEERGSDIYIRYR